MGNDIRNIAGIVRTHAASQPTNVALVQGDKTQSWAQLYERSCKVANALKAAGVGPQDRVAFLDKNGIDHFEVFYACGLLNAVSVDINWRLAPPEVAYIVNDSAAKVLIVGPDFVPVLDAIAADLPNVKSIVVIGGHSKYPSYEDFSGSGASTDPGVESAPGDVAFQLYSSGTTGRPKGVMLTNNNFFALIPFAAEIWKFTDRTVNLVAMPLFHIGGGGWATAGMALGCKSIIIRDVNPAEIVTLIGKHRITHGFLVPVLLQFMLMVPDVDKADYSSLELIAYGASPISEEVLASSMKTFKTNFMQVYGLTETTGATTILMPEDHDLEGPKRKLLRSCGKIVPNMQLRVVDSDTGKDVPVGEVGEIWVKGGQVMLGYWNMPEETAKSINPEGWFKTGDAAYQDEDGYVYIYDRVKDMVVSGGENVYPAEVENALMGHPAIADVAVIGIPDEKWGEVPMAIVVRKADVAVTEDEIIAFAKERLAGFKCPKSVAWIDALPRNPSGKILKKDLRAPYWEGRTRKVN
jgi:long-chain acyl-CoA synthetase